jgi:hypothetical protein
MHRFDHVDKSVRGSVLPTGDISHRMARRNQVIAAPP